MSPRIHPMKYHWIAFLLAALLGGLSSGHAPAAEAPTGVLMFSIERSPGKDDFIVCKLNARGTFIIYGKPQGENLNQGNLPSIRGSLSVQESTRIFEAFEKLCVAEEEERSMHMPRLREQLVSPFFSYMNLHGQMREMAGLKNPPPPKLTEFMRMLWLKLLDNASKNRHKTPATDAAEPVPAPPQILPPLIPANLR